MYVPHSGDMNYILAGNQAISNTAKNIMSRTVKMIKSLTHRHKTVLRSVTGKLSLNNA